jgi:hypothetical protein
MWNTMKKTSDKAESILSTPFRKKKASPTTTTTTTRTKTPTATTTKMLSKPTTTRTKASAGNQSTSSVNKKKATPTARTPTAKTTGNSKSASTAAKAVPSLANRNSTNYTATDVKAAYNRAGASKWKSESCQFSGSITFETKGKQEEVQGKTLAAGIKHFKANPAKYVAMIYQSNMTDWPAQHVRFSLVLRDGTKQLKATGVSPKGKMTFLLQQYQHLPPFPDNMLPTQHRDKHTWSMKHNHKLLHHPKKSKPLLPGRGMGLCDTPSLKIIGDVDPSDIHQGSVGDCWLLSAISALAEFDGAIKRLFRKTRNLDRMPMESPNSYTITLWDLETWKEVDIVVDESLCTSPTGQLLASKPSEDGELWVCYLEKALAIHCGGWDEITGGQCTHAWALMTGCKEQYLIQKSKKTGKFICTANYDVNRKQWAKHYNSPHKGDGITWNVPWPKVGGGGMKELTPTELFLKMCAWDKENYIIGAGTKGVSDKNQTDGMVDDHAYSVIDCHHNVVGSGIDLIKVRNPWGKGEIEDGQFDDDGPGWDRYPQIKKRLKPVVADDGIFYVTKEEFFNYYDHFYLSASNMTEFLED